MRVAALRCRIRPMQPGDIPQVLDIERQSFPSMWPRTVYQRELKNKMARYVVAYEPANGRPADQQPAPPASSRGIGSLLRRFFSGLRSPEPTGDGIVGMAGLWCMVDSGHIVTIAVRPEGRRQGIGELLLTAILEASLEEGQQGVTLEYRVSNHAARALYEKYGFGQVGVRARYYSDNHEDAVLMTTPPLGSLAFRTLLAQRIAEQQARWEGAYPLAGFAAKLPQATSSG